MSFSTFQKRHDSSFNLHTDGVAVENNDQQIRSVIESIWYGVVAIVGLDHVRRSRGVA